jgi:hypothetical protein
MESYEQPEILMTYSVEELAREAAACTGGYDNQIPVEVAA